MTTPEGAAADPADPRISLWSVPGIGEVSQGSDLVALIVTATAAQPLRTGDLVVVASKVVAKAEGRQVSALRRDEAIAAETERVVAARALPDGRTTVVVQSHPGPVLAAAGVDASDVPEGTVLLLPADPDASARRLRDGLQAATGARVGVLITDTAGRPWRAGVTDFCLGAAGLQVLDDRRGSVDTHGNTLSVTIRNVADEVAAAADLVKGKSAGTPVAIVRGLGALVDGSSDPGAGDLVRVGVTDWFRYGHVEAVWAALARAGDDSWLPAHGAASIDPAESVQARLARAVEVATATPRGALDAVTRQVRVEVEPESVELQGPMWPVAGMCERLLTAAWAEDLDLSQPHPRDEVEGSGVQVRLRVVADRRAG
ncbi:MAG: coenzyme F420-0:L-glutamate ligase [Actinomycetales bacterium]